VNKKECVYVWKPIESIPNEILDLQSLDFKGDTLTIVLLGEKRYKFEFRDMIVGMGTYKYTSLNSNFKFNEMFKNWIEMCNLGNRVYSLFQKFDSSYIDWLKGQSYNAYYEDYKKLVHYIFVTYDAIIEVVCMREPVCTTI